MLDDMIDKCFQNIPDDKIPVIGISGASGSGKTYLSKLIVENIPETTILHQDNYYQELSGICLGDSGKRNYDHPESFDHSLFYEHITALSKGETISQPIYDYKTHRRTEHYRTMICKKLLVVEGIMVFYEDIISQVINMKVFMDTAPDICLIRRLKRDIKDRGRSWNQVIDQYLDSVRPMWIQFIQPMKEKCDLCIGSEQDSQRLLTKLTDILYN